MKLAEVPVTLDAGASALPMAAGLVALAQRRKVPLAALSGSFGIDPLAALAAFGSIPCALDVALSDAARAPLISWRTLDVPLRDLQPLARKLHVGAVQLDGVICC